MCEYLPQDMKPAMPLVPLALFIVLFVQTSTGELSLPTLPEAVQLLQLERIRGLKQTILEKEDANINLEEMIQSVEMKIATVTQKNTMMNEEMVRMETRLQDVEDENAAEEEKNARER